MRLRGLVYSLFALSALLSSIAFAAEYYRYTDERGITVINSQGVPAHLIGNGYEVLSEQGRVVRAVPRAPTPEEYRKIQADKEQAKSDRQLLMLYTRLEDIDRALNRKIADLDGQISIARGNLVSINSLHADLQGRAASQERGGRVVSDDLIEQIKSATVDQQRLQQQISRYLQTKQEVESAFERDKMRLIELLGRR